MEVILPLLHTPSPQLKLLKPSKVPGGGGGGEKGGLNIESRPHGK